MRSTTDRWPSNRWTKRRPGTSGVDFVERVTVAEPVWQYSTRKMARYFGVSITTINNWITAGRCVGIQKAGPGKNVRISDTAAWLTSTGKAVPVTEIIDAYQATAPRPHTSSEVQAQHMADLRRLKAKYGSQYAARPPGNRRSSRPHCHLLTTRFSLCSSYGTQ